MCLYGLYQPLWVRGRLPRKQGLKLFQGERPFSPISKVRGRLPRKQGLKRNNAVSGRVWKGVRGRLPRKQGLKRDPNIKTIDAANVRGRLPRKQGLKLNSPVQITLSAPLGPRATSTKTRIETACASTACINLFGSEGDFHENKD